MLSNKYSKLTLLLSSRTGIASTDKAWTPSTTGPYAILGNRTLFSGNVYLSIPWATARDECYNKIGRSYTNILLTLASSQVTSWRLDAQSQMFEVNYADFNLPVPWRYVNVYRSASKQKVRSSLKSKQKCI